MEIHHISSIYNTPDVAESDGMNMWLDIDIYQCPNGSICLECVEREMWINEDGEHNTEPKHYTITIDNDEVIWQLIFEDIENSYRAFHAYAVGYDGSHLNYMIIEYKGCREI